MKNLFRFHFIFHNFRQIFVIIHNSIFHYEANFKSFWNPCFLPDFYIFMTRFLAFSSKNRVGKVVVKFFWRVKVENSKIQFSKSENTKNTIFKSHTLRDLFYLFITFPTLFFWREDRKSRQKNTKPSRNGLKSHFSSPKRVFQFRDRTTKSQ